MMEFICCHRLSWLALAAVFSALPGCGSADGGAGSAPVADHSRVRTMTDFYQSYLSANRNQAPKDEAAFRAYLVTKQEQFQKAGLTVDQMFTSPRNGKPLKWVYGKSPPLWRQTGMTCFGYEAEPTNGKRLVIGGRGMFDELDESQFRTVFPNSP
jgi:hypothetical protein